MPQTKVLDFITRLKMTREYEASARANNRSIISFESLMLLIAKDRKRIRNIEEKREPLLSTQPEYAMSLLQSQKKVINELTPQYDEKNKNIDKRARSYLAKLSISVNNSHKKKMNISFINYLMESDYLFQKATGEDIFLPYQWR